MKQKIIRLFSVALCVLLLLSGTVLPVYANSAQTQWEGVDVTGAIITGENSPIVVEHELLTFDIQEFPDDYYATLDEFLAYSGKVTAEYTLYNPSDLTVTAKLLFPFGNEPSYSENYDYESATSYYHEDTAQYDITVNGEVIEKRLRYTLAGNAHQFELKQDLALLHDDYVEDDFYFPELNVTKYTFTVSDVDKEEYRAANAAFDVDRNDMSRRIYFSQQSGGHTQDDGSMRVSAWAENGDTYTVYVMGEDFEVFPEWKFYEDGGVGTEIDGTMTLVGTETCTFREFALTYWTEETGVGEIDWYNAVVAMFRQFEGSNGNILYRWDYSLNLTNDLMRWYEYEITLGPGERIVNTVTAPIYPSIDISYDPGIYGYTYLLSPAQTWREFGTLDIVVNTPFYMIESSPEAFEWTNPGYTLHLEGLPEGELTFSLSQAEKPEISEEVRKSNLRGYALIFFPVAVVLLLSFGVITAVWLHKK